jgi:uncharacterized protein YcgL (UPF0745 family)
MSSVLHSLDDNKIFTEKYFGSPDDVSPFDIDEKKKLEKLNLSNILSQIKKKVLEHGIVLISIFGALLFTIIITKCNK